MTKEKGLGQRVAESQAMTEMFKFLDQIQVTQLQQLSRSFYKRAVGRVQTRIVIAKNISFVMDADYDGGCFLLASIKKWSTDCTIDMVEWQLTEDGITCFPGIDSEDTSFVQYLEALHYNYNANVLHPRLDEWFKKKVFKSKVEFGTCENIYD